MTEENTARAERAAADVVERRGTPEKDAEETNCTGEKSLEKNSGPIEADGRTGTTWPSVMTFVREAKAKLTRVNRCSETTWSPVLTSAREAKLGRQLGSRVVVGSLEIATTGKKALRGLRVSEGCVGGGGTVEGIGAVVD